MLAASHPSFSSLHSLPHSEMDDFDTINPAALNASGKLSLLPFVAFAMDPHASRKADGDPHIPPAHGHHHHLSTTTANLPSSTPASTIAPNLLSQPSRGTKRGRSPEGNGILGQDAHTRTYTHPFNPPSLRITSSTSTTRSHDEIDAD